MNGFFQAYLVAALCWLHPALGCLLLTFIHRTTGGKWGVLIQPFLRAGAATLPFALLFSIPLFFGMARLFPWAAPHPSPLLALHPLYMSHAGYILRAAIYSAVYLWLLLLSRLPQKPWTGPVGMMVYVLATYLLSVDWVVALEPGWYSTGFPVIFMASQAVSALALCIAAAVALSPACEETHGVRQTWKDLGNLMLAALLFWAYVSYGEFVIVWSGNLPAQANWYLHRNAGGWHFIVVALVLLNLLLPGCLLLSNRMKRRGMAFGLLAAAVACCQVVYLAWLVLPAHHGGPALALLLPIAAAGLFLFLYRRMARKELACA